ncbi:MAG: hypothetical protein HOV81_22535 [Kofleriaceae bacterium]|nr:hypothetical protein [Kofleriaceae bacterium]
MLRRLAPLVSCLVAGCYQRPPSASAPKQADRIAIIAAESGPQGARLVVLDENGDRQFHLLDGPESIVRDTHPVVSPDGKWVVFASSRDRKIDATSLWIAPLEEGAAPTRLTTGDALDSHPCWTRDGKAIVFASTRDGGDFDLYRLAIQDGRATGAPEPLTSGAGHEVTPTIAADGTIIYGSVTPLGGGQVESHLEERAPDGTIRKISDGPADTAPALSPDDRVLAFARPKEHNGSLDAELYTMRRNGDGATQLIDLPLTDETGPVWSPDGRYLFSTSLLRGAEGNTVFTSVIVIDMQMRPLKARMLEDRAGATARLTPAITRTALDARAIASDPEYLPELARIVANAIAAQKNPPSTP